MLFPDTFDPKSDELFLKAKELIATRSKFIPYSPTSDIYELRKVIVDYEDKVEIVVISMSVLSKATSISALGLLKYPLVYNQIMSMLKDIDRITLNSSNDYSCKITKTTIKDIASILFENCKDKIGDSLEKFGNSVESLYDDFVNGRSLSSSKKQNQKYIIGKLQFSLNGLSIAAYTMVIGWMYMHFLEKKINEHRGVGLYLDENIAEAFVEEFRLNKDAIKRVSQFACETIRTPIPDDKYYDGKKFDVERFIQDTINTINEENRLRFDLEREEHSKIVGKAIVLSSFESTIITKEIASYTTYILLSQQTIPDTILSFFNNTNNFRAFKSNWETMINRGLRNMSDYSADSLDNIKSRYCNYLIGQLNIPEYVQTDYRDYSYNLFYPSVQGVDSTVQTLYTIFDIKQREPQKTEASNLFLLWSFMFAEVFKSYGSRISGKETNLILPFLMFAMLRMFAPLEQLESDCFYNTEGVQKVYCVCKNTIPQLDDLLDYLPECFEVLKAHTINEQMWTMCVNVVMTRFMADAINNLLLRHYSVAYAIQALNDKELSEAFLSYFMPMYKRLNNY